MKIAVFGGTFDPPHIGHIEVIKEALKSLDIDRLIIVPAFLNPFKKSFIVPANKRLEWIKRLVSHFSKVEVCDFEIAQNKPTPSIKTVEFLKDKLNPEKIYLIIGADNLKNLQNWFEYERLKDLVEFVIAKRDNITIPKEYKILNTDISISSSSLRDRPKEEFIPQAIRDEVLTFFKEQNE